MSNKYITYYSVIGYRTNNRSFFRHRLRMSVSFSEAGISVTTFSRFIILLRLRRPHEPSSRPSVRPSPGVVGRGEHGSERSKWNGLSRVNKSASKRGERSESQSWDKMIPGVLLIPTRLPFGMWLLRNPGRVASWKRRTQAYLCMLLFLSH